tara:strand:+ start:100022 stop:101299 length:1278 start_codon:yes stop_codon:yes gene_type:complete
MELIKGQKQTKLGFIPNDWEVKKLKDISRFFLGLTYTPQYVDEGIPFLSVKDIKNGTINFNDTKFISKAEFKNSTSNSKPKRGDILFGRVGSLGNPILVETSKEFCIFVSLGFLRLKDNKTCPEFIVNWMQSTLFWKQVYNQVSGSSQKNLNTGWLKEFYVPFPSTAEQLKISEILGAWSESIHKYGKLLNEYIEQRKGLEQHLFSGKNRFPEFIKSNSFVKTPIGELPEDWELKHILDITQRVKKSITPEPETLYREIGIRSHCKGIFHKEEVTGASLGNKSVFWIQPDCFVVNIVFAWEHAIAKTTEAEVGMIASHRFPMYKPKKGVLDLDFLLYYFKTARGKHLLGLASPGGAGRNKTLGQGEFAKLKIPVPSLAEQKRIVAVLSEADREIELLKQQIVTLKEQKKGLMQKLLTGEIRVNVK